MSNLAIIPARGGSKSIPLKNIKLFRGKPLIAYSIELAKSAPSIDRVLVSTDSEEIASIARKFGADVPFLRPSELALDDTPDLPVFVHCLKWLEQTEQYRPEIIVQLRPTSPLRTTAIVEQAIALLKNDPEADSVRCVCEPTQNPFKMWTIAESGYLSPLIKTSLHEAYNQPRQHLPAVYWQNGYIEVIRRKTILEQNSLTGKNIKPLLIDSQDSTDIDNLLTFEFAEYLHAKREGL